MNINFFMNATTGTWHLHSGSSLYHEFHVAVEDDSSLLKKSDLSPDNRSSLNILFQSGVSPTIIAKVMTDLVQMSSEKKGKHLYSVCVHASLPLSFLIIRKTYFRNIK